MMDISITLNSIGGMFCAAAVAYSSVAIWDLRDAAGRVGVLCAAAGLLFVAFGFLLRR